MLTMLAWSLLANHLIGATETGESEIGYTKIQVWFDENILRFDITMCNWKLFSSSALNFFQAGLASDSC